MTQTLALLLDAYRELNAKKLFWITLVLSGIVAACFFFVGIDENGIKLIVWQLDNDFLNTQYISRGAFYKFIFSALAIKYWLGIAATALALISTASFFPDLCREGSIDLMLSKPISRVRLFLTRYCTGLLFAFVQVFIFTFICFLVIGIRGGVWELGLFIAVPFFVLFFSYLFAVSTIVGVFTRSTIAALLVAVLFWVALIGINLTDVIATGYRYDTETRAQIATERWEYAEGLEGEERAAFEAYYGSVDELKVRAEQSESSASTSRKFSRVMYLIKWPLPKTGETLDMLNRVIISAADLPPPEGFEQEAPATAPGMRTESEIAQETAESLERPAWWIIGTSLLFEIILVVIAGWKFCSRDY